MDRLACVYLDAFALQLLCLRSGFDDRRVPVAVVDRDHPQGRVLWVDERARRGGVLPGMRYAAGLSLLAELRAGVVDEAEVLAASERVVERLRAFSPCVEPSPEVPGLFWLDASGLDGLHPSLARWGHRLHRELRNHERLVATLVVGFRRFASYAVATAARVAGRVVVLDSARAELERARRIPLARLELDPALRERLDRLGVRTLGQLARLPEHGVAERFGETAARLHRLARGQTGVPLRAHHAVTEPTETRELLMPVEMSTERLLFVIKGLLPGLVAQLADRAEALVELRVELELDHAEPCRFAVRPAEPTLDQMQLIDLVRLRLDTTEVGAPVERVTLVAGGQRAGHEQLGLFVDKPRRDLAAANRALARVRAELGDHAVVRARLRPGHLPEARFVFEPLRELCLPRPAHILTLDRDAPDDPEKEADEDAPTPRILVRRLIARPTPLTSPTRTVRNDGWALASPLMGSVVRAIGPYIVSGGWWHSEIERSYHFVETQDGSILWVFLDRRRRRWFLHGLVE